MCGPCDRVPSVKWLAARVRWGKRESFEEYEKKRGVGQLAFDVASFIANVMHFAASKGVNVAEAMKQAQEQYDFDMERAKAEKK